MAGRVCPLWRFPALSFCPGHTLSRTRDERHRESESDLLFLPEFLPQRSPGHTILTTCAQAVGQLANRLEVDVLEEDAGVLLLLHRAGILAPDAPLAQADDASYLLARQLYEELGALPLALDQAGAYIEETQCSLQGYLDLFRRRRDLLREMTLGPEHLRARCR